MALNHLWGEWLNPKQLTKKTNRPDKIFKSAANIKTASTTSARPDESHITNEGQNVSVVQDRRKSIPEQTDRRQVSEDNHVLPDEEPKSDQVESVKQSVLAKRDFYLAQETRPVDEEPSGSK